MVDPTVKVQRIPLQMVCPEYDNTCFEMTEEEVLHCINGSAFWGLPPATGYCPMLAERN